MRYPVNELFVTIQGEGSFTGTPATFVRLQGCPVGCAWCDTKHTWSLDEAKSVSLEQVLEKDAHADESFAWCTVEEILDATEVHHVVLTGGEPCLYDLLPLTTALIEAGRSVQVETSGTHEVRVHPETFITVSPKVGMPGGMMVLASALLRASEIKMPVGRMRDIEVLAELLLSVPDDVPVWLQPLSQSPTATGLCTQQAIARGWSLSVQTHKYIGLR